jgi:outer membrane immunogenic protein
LTRPFLFGGVSLTTVWLMSSASAVDFGGAFGPPPPAFSWTGCYIGGAIGGAWSGQDVSNTALPSLDQAGVTGTINASGLIGGVYSGCNFQWASTWVIGIEGDWNGTSLSGTAVAPDLFANGQPTGSGGGIAWTSDLSSIATIRGRIGYAWSPNILAYFTGGGAWGRISYSSVDAFGPCPAVCVSTSFSNIAPGWVVGAGVDWAPWSNNWIVRVEYLHYGLQGAASSSFFPGVSVPLANPTWNNISVDSVHVGLGYKVLT